MEAIPFDWRPGGRSIGAPTNQCPALAQSNHVRLARTICNVFERDAAELEQPAPLRQGRRQPERSDIFPRKEPNRQCRDERWRVGSTGPNATAQRDQHGHAANAFRDVVQAGARRRLDLRFFIRRAVR
jgi:hypothetical protein